MSQRYPHLFSPGRIGSMELKNRIVMTPMGSNLGEGDGTIGARSRAYYLERARGGAGLLVLGSVAVGWPVSAVIPRQVAISEERHIDGIRKLAQAVHAHDCRLALQLHFGGLMSTMDADAGRPLWTPSVPPLKADRDMVEGILEEEFAALAAPLGSATPTYRVLSSADIRTLAGLFAAGAERARRAEVDGVEIHAGHGYIISEFLSPYTNQRTDDYGGSVQNRSRVLTDVIREIRDAVGRDFPVWCRLDSQEFYQPEGISLEDAKVTAQLAEAGGADAIHASAYADARYGIAHSSAHTPQEASLLVKNASAIRKAVGIPVIAVGRIEPEAAERDIAAGRYDFVAMGRKLLADPALPSKLAADLPETVRPCIYRYACNSQIYIGGSVRCAVNPETGHESEFAVPVPSAQKRLVIVGGGPAGMEAARRLAQHGHRVTLLEQDNELGGTLRLAGRCYVPNAELLRWLIQSVKALPIDVRVGYRATAENLAAIDADAVILVIGALRVPPSYELDPATCVLSDSALRELLLGSEEARLRVTVPGESIVILGNDLEALQLAGFFARCGLATTVLDAARQFGRGIPLVLRWRVLDELRKLEVSLLGGARDISAAGSALRYTNHHGQQRTLRADRIVLAQRAPLSTSEFSGLREQGVNLQQIGDCQEVAYIDGAMRSAAQLAPQF